MRTYVFIYCWIDQKDSSLNLGGQLGAGIGWGSTQEEAEEDFFCNWVPELFNCQYSIEESKQLFKEKFTYHMEFWIAGSWMWGDNTSLIPFSMQPTQPTNPTTHSPIQWICSNCKFTMSYTDWPYECIALDGEPICFKCDIAMGLHQST